MNILKNRQKNYITYHTESKSLNSSFTSNNNFGYFQKLRISLYLIIFILNPL